MLPISQLPVPPLQPSAQGGGEGRGRGGKGELTNPDRLCDQTLSFLSHRFVQGGGRGELTYPDRLCDQSLSFLSHPFNSLFRVGVRAGVGEVRGNLPIQTGCVTKLSASCPTALFRVGAGVGENLPIQTGCVTNLSASCPTPSTSCSRWR